MSVEHTIVQEVAESGGVLKVMFFEVMSRAWDECLDCHGTRCLMHRT